MEAKNIYFHHCSRVSETLRIVSGQNMMNVTKIIYLNYLLSLLIIPFICHTFVCS